MKKKRSIGKNAVRVTRLPELFAVPHGEFWRLVNDSGRVLGTYRDLPILKDIAVEHARKFLRIPPHLKETLAIRLQHADRLEREIMGR